LSTELSTLLFNIKVVENGVTTDNTEYIRSSDTAKSSATITGGLAQQLTCDNISADLRFLGDTIRKPDTYDAFEATWIVEDVSLKHEEGPLTVTIIIDEQVKGSCVINADDKKPEISLSKPCGGIYGFNHRILPLPLDKSIIFGRLMIDIDAIDNYGIECAEFYANGVKLETINNEPFSYYMDIKSMGQFVNLEVKVYDLSGNKAQVKELLELYNPLGNEW